MQDSLGNTVTTSSAEALRLIDEAIDFQSRAWPGALQRAEAATREDPDLAIGHALQAVIHAMHARRPEADSAIQRAHELSVRASPRERSLVELLVHVVRGRTLAGLGWLQAHLRRFPSDLLALTTGTGAYGLFAFSGREDHNEQRLALMDELAPHYPPDFPWLLANRGWTRIELGAVEEGLAMALRAIELRPHNAHNAHIIAHGFHEANRPAAYLDFLAGWLPGYPDTALMWGHLQWHAALAELALDRQQDAFDRCVGPIVAYLDRGLPFMGLADGPSLLWRLGLQGATGLPWARMREHAARHFPNGSNPFGEIHLAMLAAVQRDAASLAAIRGRLERLAGEGSFGALAAIAWTRALEALVEGNSFASARDFEDCEALAVRLGGSNAQRSVIATTRRAGRVPAG